MDTVWINGRCCFYSCRPVHWVSCVGVAWISGVWLLLQAAAMGLQLATLPCAPCEARPLDRQPPYCSPVAHLELRLQHPKPVPDCLRPDPTGYFKRHLTAHHLALLPPKQLPVACPLSPNCFPQVSPSVASAAPPPTPHLCLNQPSSCSALLILPDPTEYFERHPTAHIPALPSHKQLPVACPLSPTCSHRSHRVL